MSNGLLPLDRAVAQSHADGRGEHNKRPSSFYSAMHFYHDFASHVFSFSVISPHLFLFYHHSKSEM